MLANMSRDSKQAFLSTSPISPTTPIVELIDFVTTRHAIAKIDIEGHEIEAMEGAPDWLSSYTRRPKMILSEIWRKRNVTRYAEMMIGEHGYVGYALTDSVWLRDVAAAKRFHETLPREMDTIVWIVPGFEYLLPQPLRRDSRDAARHRVRTW